MGVLRLHPESIKAATVGHVTFFQHLGGFTAKIKMAVYEERRGLCCAFSDPLGTALSEDKIRPQSASIMPRALCF